MRVYVRLIESFGCFQALAGLITTWNSQARSKNFNFYENSLASYIVVQTIQVQITKRIILGVPDNPLIVQLLCIHFFVFSFVFLHRYCPRRLVWLVWLQEGCVAWEASNSNTSDLAYIYAFLLNIFLSMCQPYVVEIYPC